MAWVGKLFLYLVTMIGTIGLTYCMMDFKLKRYKQILIFAAASLICIVGDFFVSNLQTKNAELYYSIILFFNGLLLFVVVYVLSKDSFLKTMFAISSQVDALIMVVYISNTISRYFGNVIWIESIVRLVAFLTIYYFYNNGLRQKYRAFVASSEDKKAWIILVLIPVAFCILFCLTILYPITIINRPNYMHYVMLFEIVAMFLTYIGIFYTFNNIVEKNKIKLENEKAMQKIEWWKQQIDLQERIIENSRQSRHDLRHHDLLLMKMLQEGNYEKAMEYLKEHGAKIDNDVIVKYCENYTANCILTIYIEEAKKEGIDVQCLVNIPESIMIDEVELAGLLANLLENAVEACERITNPEIKRFINITTHYQTGSLRILVENSCNQEVEFDGGLPISTKQTKSGIGVKSIQKVASQYKGLVDFSQAAGVFTTRVLLNL